MFIVVKRICSRGTDQEISRGIFKKWLILFAVRTMHFMIGALLMVVLLDWSFTLGSRKIFDTCTKAEI